MVPIVPWPLTLAPTQATTAEVAEKKRKRGNETEGSEKGEIAQHVQQPPIKELRTTKAHQKKGVATGTNKGTKGEQRPKPTI